MKNGSPGSRRRANGEQAAARVQQLLTRRAFTLSDVSRESRRLYPGDRAYWIPHNLYARLRTAGFTPRMEQILALSKVTNVRLFDWLFLFGFRLDDAAACSAWLPAERTVLLDSSVYDEEAKIPWFQSRAPASPLPKIAPLGGLLESGPSRVLHSLLPRAPSPFLYAKVGRQDAFAFPDLLPGNIVRVDTRLRGKHPTNSQALYFVEHSNGLTCSRLHFSKGDRVTLRSTQLPYAEVAVQLGREARILGTLDLEFRFLASPTAPEVARDLARFWEPRPLPPFPATGSFAEFVAQRRRRTGLSLREASARSRLIADALGDERFFCSRGALAAYERAATPPHQIPRILALCALYSIPFPDVVGAAGWQTDNLGRDPIPRAILESRPGPVSNAQQQRGGDLGPSGFLSVLVQEFDEVPFFLRNSLDALTGLPNLSLRDIFWLGAHRTSLHPYLSTAMLAVVNGRMRKPPSTGEGFLREQPLYLLLRRDGSYLCARCTLEDRLLVVHPFADGFDRAVRLRNGVDAEVVGRVVTLLRRL